MDELYRAVGWYGGSFYEGAGASHAAAEKIIGAVKTKYGNGMTNKKHLAVRRRNGIRCSRL